MIDTDEGRGSGRLVMGLVFILVYALPLFMPPPGRPFVAPTDDASLFTRIFPYVPAYWVAGRLVALFAGAALIASIVRHPVVRPLRRLAPDVASPQAVHRSTPPPLQYAALLAAAAQAACIPWVSRLPPVCQSLYMVWLFVPSLLLAWGLRRPAAGSPSAQPAWQWTIRVVGALIAFWLVTRLFISWHSARAADVVDMWRMYAGLSLMVQRGGNFLVESVGPELPGVNAVPFFMQGLPLLELASIKLTLGWLQVLNSVWLALSAAVVAALAAMVVGPSTAAVAAAVLLFSPFALLGPLSPTPVFVGPLFAACPTLILLWFLRTGSWSALALFGTLAGLALTNPSLAIVTVMVLLLAAVRLWQAPRVPRVVLITALLSFLAAALPSIPGPETIRQMAKLYFYPHGQAAVLEATVFAQLPRLSGTQAGWLQSGASGGLDVPLATLLSPFAISRTSMRLWGDALFDPFGTGLAAVGVAICLRHGLRGGTSALLLAFLAATLVTGFISSTDQPSLLRVMGAPVAVALMAAVGFAGICATLPSSLATRTVPAVTLLAIIAGGLLLFDGVNPGILRASALGLMMRSVHGRDLDRAALLMDDRERPFWRFADEITRQVPQHPIPIVQYEDLAVDRSRAAVPTRELLFWSPAVEDTAGMTARLCERWPDAALYTILDKAGLSRLYAANLRGPGWTPAVPANQWTMTSCASNKPLTQNHRRYHRRNAGWNFPHGTASTNGRVGS